MEEVKEYSGLIGRDSAERFLKCLWIDLGRAREDQTGCCAVNQGSCQKDPKESPKRNLKETVDRPEEEAQLESGSRDEVLPNLDPSKLFRPQSSLWQRERQSAKQKQ